MSDIDKTIAIENGASNSFTRCPVCGAEMNMSADHHNSLRCPICNFVKKYQPAFEPGCVVMNKYRILSLLNGGAFGNIFICHPLSDVSVRYAMKVLKNSCGNSLTRFRREAEVLSSLHYEERITRIIDYWDENDCMIIVMEYVQGVNLKQARKEYDFDEYAVWQIARETIIALKNIWDTHHIIHRDIKPENIMLDENFQLKLLDFGLSKHCEQDDGSITELTLANSTLGTPGYMSPEQFSDAKNVDFKTDMFSLGATLYFLLTGEHPFCGDTLDVVYHSTIKNSPPPVEALAEYCSAQSINIIRRMMQKEPAKRYPSYDELLGDIIQLLCQLSDGQ